jgi:hypothetical protein
VKTIIVDKGRQDFDKAPLAARLLLAKAMTARTVIERLAEQHQDVSAV